MSPPKSPLSQFSPTQSDIAAQAGVDRSTVSRAFKNHPSIPAATRERILKVAAQLGYRENPYVKAQMQAVRSKKAIHSQATIAFLTPYMLERWYERVLGYRKIYESAKARAYQLGFELDPISLVDQGIDSHRCNDILVARGVDGVLVAPFENPFMRLRLDWERFSIASLGFVHVRPRFSYASANLYFDTTLILRKLRRQGYRRIGLAMPERTNRYAEGMIEAAYLVYANAQPTSCRLPYLAPPNLDDWNEKNFLKWYDKYRPEVIVCQTNEVVPEWLHKAGLKIPDDVGLATLSRHGISETWSGIDQHNELVGAAGVQIIAEQLNLNQRGLPTYPRAVLIEGDWDVGWTTRQQR